MIRWTWRGVVYCVEFPFFAAAAWIALCSGTGWFWMAASACMLHELGHLAAMTLLGYPVRSVTLCGVGVTIRPGEAYQAYWKDICVLLAGPAVNLTLGLLLWLAGAETASLLHLGLGLFNLLPYTQLDGGGLVRAVCFAAGADGSRTAQVQKWLSLLCAGFLLTLGILFRVRNISLYAMAVYLLASEWFQ